MSRFNIGDRIHLTGDGWSIIGPDNKGQVFVVAGFEDDIARSDGFGVAAYFLDDDGVRWYLDESTDTECAAEIVLAESSIETLVRNFHHTFGHPVAITPHLLPGKRAWMRYDLIEEEIGELVEAIDGENLVEIADALADIVWLCYGAAAEYGIELDPVLREVARSNDTKLDENGQPIIAGPNDPDGYPEGKIKKGPNYQPPQIAPILEAQRWAR